MVLHYKQFKIILLKGINCQHFTQKPKLLIVKHRLNKPRHEKTGLLFSPYAHNISMKIHIAFHHVGCYDDNMRRKQNLWPRPCLHGSRQILAQTFLDFLLTLIGENSVTECSDVYIDMCKFRLVTAFEWFFLHLFCDWFSLMFTANRVAADAARDESNMAV